MPKIYLQLSIASFKIYIYMKHLKLFLCRCSKRSASYAKLESAMIKFLSKCCWCHPANQKLLAELLTEVIIQQKAPAGTKRVFRLK